MPGLPADLLGAAAPQTLRKRNRLPGQEQGEGSGAPATRAGETIPPQSTRDAVEAQGTAVEAAELLPELRADSDASTAPLGQVLGVSGDPGAVAAASQQQHPPPSGATATATATASLQSLVVSGAPHQLAAVQGSVAQGLPVPDSLAGNENISVPIVATGVPVSDAHTTHVAAGALAPVGDGEVEGSGGAANAQEDDTARGASQKRIADVDLSLQIENGALSPVSKALKVGSASLTGGKVAVGQRSTPHS